MTVCSLYDKGEIGLEMEKLGIEVVCLQKAKNRFDWTIVRDIYRLIKEKNTKIVRTHRYNANLYGRLAAILARVPCIIASVHNIYMRDRKINRRIVNHILSRLTDYVVAVSETVKKDIVRYDAIPLSKIKVIFNGVDMNRFLNAHGAATRREFNIPLSAGLIGSVGRLTDQKGLTYLLEALSEVIRTHPETMLLLVGDGERKDELKAHVERLHIQENVIFAGWRGDIPEILNALDIFAFPSLWEGLPNALIEAMAAGKPIVATDIPPIRELIISQDNGILVAPNDSAAIAAAITSLLRDREYAATLGKTAQMRARALFSVDSTMNTYTALFQQVLEKKGSEEISCSDNY